MYVNNNMTDKYLLHNAINQSSHLIKKITRFSLMVVQTFQNTGKFNNDLECCYVAYLYHRQ